MARPVSEFWTPERDQILCDHYPFSTAAEICARFGWNVKPVRLNTRANVLGVKKAEEDEQARTLVQQFEGYRVVTHRMAGA